MDGSNPDFSFYGLCMDYNLLKKGRQISIIFFAINPKKKIKSKINKTYVFVIIYVIRHSSKS